MVDGGRFFIVKLQKPAIYLESLTTVSTWLDRIGRMSSRNVRFGELVNRILR